MRELAAHYHGPWDEIRDRPDRPRQINYTWFEPTSSMPRGTAAAIVLIGDAAHVCPPTSPRAPRMALEDAAVLAELLLARRPLRPGPLAPFMDRRLRPRRQWVVDASVQLAQWLLDRVEGDVPALIAPLTDLVSKPA